jgi:hypothetical protein
MTACPSGKISENCAVPIHAHSPFDQSRLKKISVWLKIRRSESNGVVFENRSGAYIGVREHRKRRKLHQLAVATDFQADTMA